MVYKLLLFACMVALMLFFFSSSQDTDQQAPVPPEEAVSRRSTNVVMVERSVDSGRTMQVRAREVTESGTQVARFTDFLVEQDGGPRLSGTDATYDRAGSLLTVYGPLAVEARDETRVHLDGLRWDRARDLAETDRPVRFEGLGGIVTADRASFSDGFTAITLTGRVHAKIMRTVLDL